MQLNKTGVVLSSDKLTIENDNALTYSGTLRVTLAGTPVVAGDTFDLFDPGSFLGTFATLDLQALYLPAWRGIRTTSPSTAL